MSQYIRIWSGWEAHRKILERGVPGRARIQSMTMPPRGAAKFNLGMALQVFVEGRNPYEVEDQWLVSAEMPLGFGMVLPVKVDRDDPHRVAIDWKAHFEAQTEAKGARRDALAGLGPVPAGGIGDMITETTTVIDARDDPKLRSKILEALEAAGLDVDRPQGGGDPTLQALERLAELRDRGVLSESEFRAQKRWILGDG